MPDRSRKFIALTVSLLLLLGTVAGAVGFGLAALSEVQTSPLQLSATQLSIAPLEKDTPLVPVTPSITGIPPTASPKAPRTTSTPQPELAALATTSSPTSIIVLYGESLYPVCRRNCPGMWLLDDVPQSLVSYAQVVSQLNGISWNNGHPLVYSGQRLDMPPCPQP